MPTILVLEDDSDLRAQIADALAEAGYTVLAAADRHSAQALAEAQRVDLALCDVNLSSAADGEGFAFCRWLKAHSEAAVLFVSARDLEEDVLTGYELGADDYVTKPFSMKVLLKKIAVVLARVPAQTTAFDDGWLCIDLERGSASRDGEQQPLTPTEQKILRQLLANRGRLQTYGVLLDALWEDGAELSDKHALAVNINRLRKKLEDAAHSYISNVYGMGYLWK